MLPAVEHAYIDPTKVRDYLLSVEHPVGRFKAVVFQALGYKAEEWETLRNDLLALARTAEAADVSVTTKDPAGKSTLSILNAFSAICIGTFFSR